MWGNGRTKAWIGEDSDSKYRKHYCTSKQRNGVGGEGQG